MGERSTNELMARDSGLMLAGVVLQLVETHGHEHEDEALKHEYAHRHDEGHHEHVHDSMPTGEHSPPPPASAPAGEWR